jgi:hypothetical protein
MAADGALGRRMVLAPDGDASTAARANPQLCVIIFMTDEEWSEDRIALGLDG